MTGGGDKALGQRIKELRWAHRTPSGKRLTQDQLADAIGVQEMAISRWERGFHMPGTAHLEALAQFFGITMDELRRGPRQDNVVALRRDPRDLPAIQEMLSIWPDHSHPPDDDDLAFLAHYAKFHRMTAVGLMTTLLTARSGMTPEQHQASVRATEAFRDPEVPPRGPRRSR